MAASVNSSYGRGQKVLNAIAIAAELGGEATVPAKQLETVLAVAQVFEEALQKIMRRETSDDPEGIAELALAEANRMIEAM